MWLFISNLNSLTFKLLKFLAQAFLNLLNGLNPGFAITLIVRSSRLGKNKLLLFLTFRLPIRQPLSKIYNDNGCRIGSRNVRNNKSLFFPNLDDRTIKLMEKPGFKPFSKLRKACARNFKSLKVRLFKLEINNHT